METDMETKERIDPASLYKTQWKAYFKRGLGSPTIVYGESMEEAMKNALAYYRKNSALLSEWPMDKVVEKVEYIG